MQLIDTHVHVNFDVFQPDIEAVRSRWQEAGVSIQSLANRFPEMSFAVGLHPLDAEKWNQQTAEEIVSLAGCDSKVVAIGETGLDFYKADNKEQQRHAFETQLAIATELNLPVIIHCRNAATEVREVLQKWKQLKGDSVRGVRSQTRRTAQ
jgi:TatD DNase family protein